VPGKRKRAPHRELDELAGLIRMDLTIWLDVYTSFFFASRYPSE